MIAIFGIFAVLALLAFAFVAREINRGWRAKQQRELAASRRNRRRIVPLVEDVDHEARLHRVVGRDANGVPTLEAMR
jgi:hypothetical protein